MSGTAAAHDDPPRRRVVRDPVHDYVEIPGELEPLVASAALQRLRNISQNGRANRRYPSLTGSRYEHALGTMHLARAGWQSAWRTCEEDVRQRFAREVVTELRAAPDQDPCTASWVSGDDVEDTALWADFERVMGLAVGAVGLVHDLGHPPFSHVLERFYQERIRLIMGADAAQDQAEYAALTGQAQFHEWAGLRIFDRLPGECFRHLPRLLVRLIVSDRSGDDWTDCLHSIIDGQFDVDRLDYLMRDGSGPAPSSAASTGAASSTAWSSIRCRVVGGSGWALAGSRRSRRCSYSARSTTGGSSTTRPRSRPTRR